MMQMGDDGERLIVAETELASGVDGFTLNVHQDLVVHALSVQGWDVGRVRMPFQTGSPVHRHITQGTYI
jgi:hypothetical protein